MSDYCIIYRGVETGDNNKWLANIKFTDEWKPILLGKDVHRFSYNHSGTYVKFIPKQLKSNANINYYNKNKILMRRTGNSIIACADYCKFIALKNLYLIIPENDNYIPIILLQLNSKLFAYIHQLLTTGENKPFAQFPAFYVEKLPCKIDDRFLEKAKVLLDKMQEYIIVKSDTTTLEKEINQLVYQLYGLTEEEIKIVEGEKN
ncbi:MAG: TaqI-like C-terminal specificity domain-containing protein [Snowella sp.]|nr:TaqI-like C-terminal specificity domain-containing protein [Snowella sp.]